MRINEYGFGGEFMGCDRFAAKSRIDMTLSEDLVRRARLLTANLSDTVEQCLAGFVEQASERDTERQRAIERHVEASNAFAAKHGSLADEFPAL